MAYLSHSRASSRSGFGTLTLIGIVVALLLVTGIGQYIWRQSTQLGAHCRDAMLSIGFNAGLDTCDSIGQSIVSFQRRLEQSVGATKFGDTMNLEEFSGHIARQFSSAAIGYSSPQLSNLINPSMLQTDFDFSGASPLERMRYSVTQGAQGNSLLKGGNTSAGLGYLQSSASMGDAGLLSQLQLGSAFASGGNGLQPSSQNATYYYKQALDSITSLQSRGDPASASLLQSLPAPAEQMKSQLQQVLSGQP